MDGLFSIEECFEQLLELLKSAKVSILQDGNLPPVLVTALENMQHRAKNTESSKIVFEFAKQKQEEKLVRIVSADIPDGILPGGYAGKLHDTKVNSRAADDKVYEEHPDIREKIPRGTTFLELDHAGNNMFELVIYGNRKFTGGLGDEDEETPAKTNPQDEDSNGVHTKEIEPVRRDLWRDYCLQDPDTAEKIICMDKLNGEAAHFSGRYINGQFYIVTGSKFVHMLIRNKEDIKLYLGDRYKVARIVATSVCQAINALQETQRKILFSLLHETKCTVVCELLQPENQHLVNLSYLSQPEINTLSLTPTSSGAVSDTSLLALPPHHAIELLKALGLKTVDYRIKSVHEGIQIRDQIRRELNKEGEVLYYVMKSEDTIGIVKTKTLWYIVLRALREKATFCFTTAKKRANWNLEDRITSTLKRFDELQLWLKFPNDYLEGWKELASGLLRWLDEEIKEGRWTPIRIRPMFPVIWEDYLKHTDLSDNIPLSTDYGS